MLYFKQHSKKVNDYKLQDCYKWYKNEYKNPISSWAKYSEIVEELDSIFVHQLIYNAIDFKMPSRMGHIRIKKTKCKIMSNEKGMCSTYPPDWSATKKLWEETYPGLTSEEITKIKNKKVLVQFNKHTDSNRCRFHWDRTMSEMMNQSYYYIVFVRKHKKNLTDALNKDSDLIYKYFN